MMDNKTLDQIEKTLSFALHYEQNVAYEFTNNDYHCARSAGDSDPYYAEMALRIRDDVDRIKENHNTMIGLLKDVIQQAKQANHEKQHETV